MQTDPFIEAQRLAQHYAEMYDQELLNLAEDSADLTEVARQALDAEMRKRNLHLPQERPQNAKLSNTQAENEDTPFIGGVPDADREDPSGTEQGDEQVEYTWKTPLCECETMAQANELADALRQAGIDCWINEPRATTIYSRAPLGNTYPRIYVAADQLEQARSIASSPIAKKQADAGDDEPAEFVASACPKCGASDPTLESVDSSNHWKCESCGNEWAETAGDEDSGAAQGADRPQG